MIRHEPSMNDGVVMTTDGGMSEAQQSTDGGESWTPSTVPRRTAAAAYTDDGTLLSAALTGDHASVSRKEGNGWVAVR